MNPSSLSSSRRAWPDGIAPRFPKMADGWPLRMLVRPSAKTPARGSILFQGGRGDMIEKYLESLDHWHRQGWTVGAFDWRGQGGSGRVLEGQNIGHIEDFAIWIEDLGAVWKKWKAEHPGPHVIIGHSMGGHLVLRALIEKAIDPTAAILSAPMLGFDTGPLPVSISEGIVRLVDRLGLGERQAWKNNERPATPWASRQRFLTQDLSRYADEQWWRAQNPDLVLGPPSIRWLVKAQDSNALIAAPGAVESVTVPVLTLGTDADKLVSPKAIRKAVARFPHGQSHIYGPECAHEILRGTDPVRDDALARIDRFLDSVAPRR